MSKLVIINLEKGNLTDGFSPVTAQIWEVNQSRPVQFTASLPPAPQIIETYQRFQLIYQSLYHRINRRSGLEIEECGLTNVSEVDFTEVCQQLHKQINTWLNCDSFRPIDQQLRARLVLTEEIQIIIETSDRLLQKLPWHLWNFLDDYQKAEVSIGTPRYEKIKTLIKNNSNQVRILAILGNSEGIDIEQDRALLQQLPNAQTIFLVEPSRQEFDRWLWHKDGWDILFFAGHSQSDGDTGHIQINQITSLKISELKNGLKYAITRGLKLAIFNSCDGLGLANQLVKWHIPQVIVMREDVPDVIAQSFLKYFLTAFADNQSFYLAVRYARERLQGLEDEFPGASWLPTIYQNPAAEPPTWNQLSGKTRKFAFSWLNKQSLKTAIIASLVATGCVGGMRAQGIIQEWELKTFDMMMRLRPEEGKDPRILVVTVTEADIQAQQQRQKSSLSDRALAQLLQILAKSKPRAIGLDIYRDFPVEAKYQELAKSLRQNQDFFAICKVSESGTNGISPPPELPNQRIGFSDVVRDRDFIVRRHLLILTPDLQSPCKTNYSLGVQLAKQYLAKQGISLDINHEGYLQAGKVVFRPIDEPTGSYQKFDARGHQILLNYRSTKQIAQTVTLTEILNHKLDPNLVSDRIVLIGVSAESVRDTFLTPYSMGNMPYQEIPGVLLHAQMISQILSAVLDHRPLLWVWPLWVETFWIWGWSLIGGVIALYRGLKLQLALIASAAVIILSGCCFGLLMSGGWIPFLSPLLALVITIFIVMSYTSLIEQKK
ncbi:CHASE2 domain-containing protein [Nostoc sp. FACHB-110]|uniref:CHASE2 domain-containing protein n=1 Tax=Nostoc sp. FACHB-110 TaxID=2692834 RepID=UPI001687D57E|nr:CHASE2 domain-containing protein [Nostoc sp. FACHB-110]MBD2438439.1 CHASE2 domain-containing protein [Nostoc sp. FACHB-110]